MGGGLLANPNPGRWQISGRVANHNFSAQFFLRIYSWQQNQVKCHILGVYFLIPTKASQQTWKNFPPSGASLLWPGGGGGMVHSPPTWCHSFYIDWYHKYQHRWSVQLEQYTLVSTVKKLFKPMSLDSHMYESKQKWRMLIHFRKLQWQNSENAALLVNRYKCQGTFTNKDILMKCQIYH